MIYKVKWTEIYETEVESETELTDEEAYDSVDFESKNCMYSGLDELEVERVE